jgi:hypothetical protein
VKVIDYQKPLQSVPIKEAQEIAPLLGGEGHVNRVPGSEPNATGDKANAMREVCHHVAQVEHRRGTLKLKAIQNLDLQLLRVHAVTSIFTRSFLSITAGSRTRAPLNDLMLSFTINPALW